MYAHIKKHMMPNATVYVLTSVLLENFRMPTATVTAPPITVPQDSSMIIVPALHAQVPVQQARLVQRSVLFNGISLKCCFSKKIQCLFFFLDYEQ